jgi:hypothetical protein
LCGWCCRVASKNDFMTFSRGIIGEILPHSAQRKYDLKILNENYLQQKTIKSWILIWSCPNFKLKLRWPNQSLWMKDDLIL